ncbi:hypothetical protein VNI00_018351, partial [Paramarasmius palmivorus]
GGNTQTTERLYMPKMQNAHGAKPRPMPDPHKCFTQAKRLLDALPPKWNPTYPQPEDYERRELPWKMSSEECVAFDPKITTDGDLEEAFRIFTEEVGGTDIPNTEVYPENGVPPLDVYTDGSCTNNGGNNAEAGAGIFVNDTDYRNRAIKVPRELEPSNQVGELLAVKEVAETFPPLDLNIMSDSKYVIEGITKHLKKWEDSGYIGVENAHLFQVTAARLRARKALTTFQWVKGHSGIDGNEKADSLANEGRGKTSTDLVDMTIPPPLHISGAKLKGITQAQAYKAIRQIKKTSYQYQRKIDRKRTTRNVENARRATERLSGEKPSTKQFWRSLKNKTISRQVRNFLYKIIHGAYRLGKDWEDIPGCESRARCPQCQSEETLQHILLECTTAGQAEVWEEAETVWREATASDDWEQPTLDVIMACANVSFGADELETRGKTRLYQILVLEAAFLIWKMRNERVINESGPKNLREIKNRWKYTIDSRRKIDVLLTNKRRYGKKALSKGLVSATWGEERDQTLGNRGLGVLVSSG